MKHFEQLMKIYTKKNYPFTDEEKRIESVELQQVYEADAGNNTIALLEPNDYHGECFPSYIKYFIDLGFNVHLYTTKKNFAENSLINCRFPENKFTAFTFSKFPISDAFFRHLLKYKYVFLLSLLCSGYIYYAKVLMDKYFTNNQKKLFVINHEIDYDKTTTNIENDLKNNTFVLRDQIKYSDSRSLPFISPIYFGEYSNILKMKNNTVTKIICIGGTYQNNLRNFDNLFSIINNLITNKILNFEITFVGCKQKLIDNYTNETNKPYIRSLERVDFKTLYQEVLNTDFILFNIDSSTSLYEQYLKKKISGSYSLTVGFCRPGIVDYNLAKEYKIENGSIVYNSKSELYNAICKAINIDSQSYKNMQEYLFDHSNTLKEKSIKNLQQKLK